MNIIILGVPGSGKGTQAEKLAKKFGLYYLGTGDISRKWAKRNKRIKKIIQSGKLIPEKEMTKHTIKILEKDVPSGKNIIFEGWPRFIDQYEDLINWLSKKGQKIDLAFFLDIKKEVVVKRLSSRRVCSQCGEIYNIITQPPPSKDRCECGGRLVRRKDDNPKSIKSRFDYYRNNTGKLVDFLRQQGQLTEIDGDRPIEPIFKDIVQRLKKARLVDENSR